MKVVRLEEASPEFLFCHLQRVIEQKSCEQVDLKLGHRIYPPTKLFSSSIPKLGRKFSVYLGLGLSGSEQPGPFLIEGVFRT